MGEGIWTLHGQQKKRPFFDAPVVGRNATRFLGPTVIWTSMAHHSQWIFMLARTDPEAPKHRGISYFLVHMHTPGITVKPLIDMSNGHHFNEVYFENVRVPRSGLLGELNRGWYMATTTLSYERSGIEGPAAAARYVRLLTQYAQETQRTNGHANARPLWPA